MSGTLAPLKISAKASSFHCSPDSHAAITLSMFFRSLEMIFLPGEAMIIPRSALDSSFITSASTRSATPAFTASIPASISGCSMSGLGRFCGWKRRPDQRPVRSAPRNCSAARSRPSLDTARMIAAYLAVELVVADSLICRSWRTASGSSGSFMRLSRVSFFMSGRSTPYSCRMNFRSWSRLVALSTAPTVMSATSTFRRRCSWAMVVIAASANSTSA